MEYKKYKLGDICKIFGRIGFRGYTTEDLVSSPSNGAISLSPSNIVDGIMDLSKCTYISWEKYEESPEIKIAPNDIVIVKTGNSYGRTAIIRNVEHPMTLNPQFVVLKDIQINPVYLAYFLKTDEFQKQIYGIVGGSAIPTFSQENLANLIIRVPNDNIPNTIADILDSLDGKIELNKQINDNLEAIAKQLYDYWFVQFDFPNEEGKPYKSSGGAMVWNDKLKRDIPQGWHCGTLLDIAEYTNGLACQKYRPTDNNKLPVIKIKEMHDGLSADTEWVKADIPDDVKVFDGDVLFSWSASLEVMLWAYGNGGLNQHIFKVTSKNGYPRSFYFYQLIHYVGVFKQIAEARKTTMGHITQDHLRQSTIALPPNIDVANKLEEKLCPIFDAIVKNNQEIMALTKQRDELLPLLMNGQASVNYHLSAFRGFTTRLQIHAFTIKSS